MKPLCITLCLSLLSATTLAACAPRQALAERDAVLAEQARYERLAAQPDSLLSAAEQAERDSLAVWQFDRVERVRHADEAAGRHRAGNVIIVIGILAAALTTIGYFTLMDSIND